MDNKKKLTDAFLGLSNNATAVMDILKSGEGLGLTPDQKIEFEKAKAANNSDAVMKDVQDKLEQFRKKVSGL